MNIKSLIIGILIGGCLVFAVIKLNQKKIEENKKALQEVSSKDDWQWPESLDAIKAAPGNHKIVYEDDNIRVLAVILDGKKSEPIHTHRWKSIMWISKPIVPCQINNYKKDKNDKLIKSDSLIIKEMPTDIGQLINPEGPTSITNLGSENGVAYRVEFKKEFVK